MARAGFRQMKRYLLLILLITVVAGCATIDTFFNRKARFREFKSGFAEASLPFSVDSNMNCGMRPEKIITSKYRKFLPQYLKRFAGRGLEPAGRYVAHLHKDSLYDLFVVYFNTSYIKYHSEFYQLVTYNSKGYIIDDLVIADKRNRSYKTCKIDKDLNITIHYSKDWPRDHEGSYSIIEQPFFKINKNGHFIAQQDKQNE
jgi:hypothetical protein